MRRRETEGGIYNNAPLPFLFHNSNDGGKDRERDSERTCAREKGSTQREGELGRDRGVCMCRKEKGEKP